MKVAEIVTNKILEHLENGVVPWRQTWASTGIDRNMISGHEYRGMNKILVKIEGRSTPLWATFNQIRKNGGTVKAGEKGTLIVFWTFLKDEKDKTFPMLRYYTIFNYDQTEGIEKYKIESESNGGAEVSKSSQDVLDGYLRKERIQIHPGEPSYNKATDIISLPDMKSFQSTEEYYMVAFHESVHSTGIEKRLNRNTLILSKGFGDDPYSKEELVAEIGACMLASETGLNPTYDNSASYIKNWTSRIKDDKMMIITASGQAQKACDYIIGKEVEDGESGE